MFIYGLYLWGCHWEKGSSELVDVPTKSKEAFTNLPVIHLTCWSESDKPLLNDPNKAPYLYKCPAYMTRNQRNQSILDIDLINSNNLPSKWSMRGVCCTLKPF
jgi:dynein heavy chain, axonemal